MAVLVVGAGVVGLSCAFSLAQDGHAVTVIDRDPRGDKASFGNAGGIAVTEVVPAAGPGVIWRVPGWLMDPLGPLALRFGHARHMLPWLRRFMRAGRPAETARIAAQLAALNARVYDDLLPLLRTIGMEEALHQVGALTVYESGTGFVRDAASWALRRAHGIVCDILDGNVAREMEPALSTSVIRAVFTPQWSHIADPKDLVDVLRDHLAGRGVRILQANAAALEAGTSPAIRLDDGSKLSADAVVVAAGAWSARLAATLGDRALLESERGYNVTLPHPHVALTREIIFAERHFVATPLAMGLRIGGAAEFTGLDAPANHARGHALVTLAHRYLPGLDSSDGAVWMGQRPTTPDSLPVIGASPRGAGIFYAFGHGHLGLTQSATTGRLIADLVAGRTPPLDLAAFGIGRFA